MKRPYIPPTITKYNSPSDIPEDLRRQLQLDPSLVHEFLNMLQVISARCDLLEIEPEKQKEHVKVIKNVLFKMSDRLLEHRKKSA